MRTSRVPHPLGGRHVQIHLWAVESVGFSAAALLGVLDFLDRARERPGELLASRARIIADLEGIVGRSAVDKALDRLREMGWIRRVEKQIEGNISTRDWYLLAADEVERYMISRGITVVPKMGQRRPETGTGFGPENGTTSNKEEEEEKQQKQSSPGGAAAREEGKKRRRVRESGIVTWDAADEAEAARLEGAAAPESLRAAVNAVQTHGKQPVPGLVSQALEREQRSRERRGEEEHRLARARQARSPTLPPLAERRERPPLRAALNAVEKK